MIQINFLRDEIDLNLYECLIFTSKNAIRAIDKIDKGWIEKEIYSIGKGTAQEVVKYDANLVFTSQNSYGDRFAQEIKDRFNGKKVLFPRAKEITSHLNLILKENGVDLDEKIIYETTCREYQASHKPPSNAKIIFSSPSTVKCFFKNFYWDESYKAIAIGDVTAATIPAHVKKYIAREQTLQSCVDLAKSI